MNYFNKILKVFLVAIMLGVSLITPLNTSALEITDAYSYEEFEDLDFDIDLDFDFSQDNEMMFDTSLQPAYTGYVPEMLFADDTLADIDETEIFFPIMETNSANAAPGSGIIQFVLEPVAHDVHPNYTRTANGGWITMARARAAAFNVDTIFHRVFTTATGNSYVGVNGRFGRDAIFLGVSPNGQRYRILIAGMIGYVNRVDALAPRNITVSAIHYGNTTATTGTIQVRANAQFIPFANYPNNPEGGGVRSVSHYVNRNGELWRYLTNNVTGQSMGGGRFLTGPAPTWMTTNVRYYSFDGVYFYSNPRNIRADGSGAINANNPFFNYFQYLSFRSASTVTAAQLDAFLVNSGNNAAWHQINTTNSVMRNQGQAFVNAQNRYGINALLMYAKGMHESAGGTSSIARNNNNLFGLGAFDATPAQSANWFPSPEASVNSLARGWLSRGYLWHTDWRNAGPHAGHKGSGMNVRYATDPYWGQKVAGWAFRIDRSRPQAERDFNREQIAVRQNTVAVNVQNVNGETLYTANRYNYRFFPFLVAGTGSNNRLRIVTDTSIVNGVVARPYGCTISSQSTCDERTNARYNLNLFNRTTAVGYIPNNNVWLTGATQPGNNITTPTQEAVTTANVNFRHGPGTNYGIIRLLSTGTHVTILGTNANGTWSRVRQGNQEGWISSGFLNVLPTSASRGWVQSGGQWFFYNDNGQRHTGWLRRGERWYFLNPSSGQSGHTANLPHGTMRDGWVQVSGRWYFLNPRSDQSGHTANLPHGAMRDGWVWRNGNWYFLNPRAGTSGHTTNLPHGAMQTGWVHEGGSWFFMNNSGRMQTGWVHTGGSWFFMNNSGRMQTGRVVINGVAHMFNASGRWLGRAS